MFLLNTTNHAALFQAVNRFTRLKPVQDNLQIDGSFQYEVDTNDMFYGVEVSPAPKYNEELFGHKVYGDNQILILINALFKTDYQAIATTWDLDHNKARLLWKAERTHVSNAPPGITTTHLDQGQAFLTENGIDGIDHNHVVRVTKSGSLVS